MENPVSRGTELAVYTPHELDVMADRVAKSGMFGMTREQAFTLMLLCQSKGLHPIEAVQRYHIIQGRPAMKADAMLAEFQARGGTVDWRTSSDQRCHAIFAHPTQAPKGLNVEFTVDDAKRADLLKNPTWHKYPANMLRARVISNGVRMILPGIVAGIYTPEECEDMPPMRAEARVAEPAAIEQAPAPEPEERPLSKADLKAQASLKKTWALFSTDAIAATNDRLHGEAREAGLEIDPRASACNIHQLHRHMLKWGFETGEPYAASIPEGRTISPRDASLIAGSWWDKGTPKVRAEIRAEVGRYLMAQVDAALAVAAADGPTIDAEPDDEAAEVDEDAVLAMGREPGEEG